MERLDADKELLSVVGSLRKYQSNRLSGVETGLKVRDPISEV
jgi:hypothetical protein